MYYILKLKTVLSRENDTTYPDNAVLDFFIKLILDTFVIYAINFTIAWENIFSENKTTHGVTEHWFWYDNKPFTSLLNM